MPAWKGAGSRSGRTAAPGGDGHSGGRDHVPDAVGVFGSTGSSTNKVERARWSMTRRAFAVEPAVEVHGEVPVWPARRGRLRRVPRSGDSVRGGERVGAAGSVHFHRGEPGVDLFRYRSRLGWARPRLPTVGPHLVAYRAAEHHVHGMSEDFARDIPQSLSSPATALDSTGPPW